MKNYYKNGFTLIELSIVLVIITMLYSISIQGSKFFLKQSHIRTTNSKLETIENALNVYLIQNNKLPCPSNLESNSGISNNCSLIKNTRGGVPYKELNLSQDLSYDAWRNKIIYSVSPSSINDVKEIEKDFKGISIYTNGKENEDRFTDSAIYTLVSCGENKFGCYNFDKNSQNSISEATVEERINFNKITSNDDLKNVYFVKSNKGDDIVKYKNKNQILIDNNIEDINCYITSEKVEDLYRNSNISGYKVFNTSIGSSVVDISFTIPTNNFLLFNEELEGKNSLDETKLILKCYKYGRLGIYEKK